MCLRVPREGEVSPAPGSAQPQAPSADVQSHYSPPPKQHGPGQPSMAQYNQLQPLRKPGASFLSPKEPGGTKRAKHWDRRGLGLECPHLPPDASPPPPPRAGQG